MSWAGYSVKNWGNLPTSNPKAYLYNIKAHVKVGENPLRFTQVIVLKVKWMYCGQITLSKMDEILPLAIPKQMSTISMQIPTLVAIHWYLLKLLSRYENTIVSRADNSVKNWQTLPISNPTTDLHNINAHTKFGEYLLIYAKVIIRKWKYRSVTVR